MKALVWHGRMKVQVDTVPDPVIEEPRDAIVRVISTAICGSDLHLYDGYIPTMEKGDILGHEFMGEVVEVGSGKAKLKVGDRVVVPFNICRGECFFCKRGQWSCCERTNRDADQATKMFDHKTAGLFGYSHLTGHYPGGQAEYARVPFADVCPTKVPDGLTDEQVLFLTDIFPTGYQGAEFAEIEPGDTVAVWGCGPVGQFCCANDGYDLLIVADEGAIEDAASDLRALGGRVEAIEADLSTTEGVDRLLAATGGRPIDALLANAGRGLGKAFLDQDFEEARHVLDTNVTGTIYLLHEVGQEMRSRGRGKILITGSIAGFMPGSYQAVYNATKAFLDSFSYALREELTDTGVTVTCLMQGATETEFFRRADMMNTKVGTSEKADPADVATLGFKAMQKGEDGVIEGLGNKFRAFMAHIMPTAQMARQHTKMAEPGTAKN